MENSMNKNGCSTTLSGQEKYEYFVSSFGRKKQKLVQYDYRTTDGKLFTCVAKSLDAARNKRDAWINSLV